MVAVCPPSSVTCAHTPMTHIYNRISASVARLFISIAYNIFFFITAFLSETYIEGWKKQKIAVVFQVCIKENHLTPNYEILHTQNGDFIEKKRNKHCSRPSAFVTRMLEFKHLRCSLTVQCALQTHYSQHPHCKCGWTGIIATNLLQKNTNIQIAHIKSTIRIGRYFSSPPCSRSHFARNSSRLRMWKWPPWNISFISNEG